jgi:hypothetical protein
MSRPIALGLARTVLDELQDSGELFTETDWLNRVIDRAADEHPDLQETALEGLLCGAIQQAKRERVNRTKRVCRQPSFPGFDVGGIYALGNSQFIAKEAARREHFLAACELSRANRMAVDTADDLTHEEFDRLDPYLGPDVTKAQAIECYAKDNPSEEVA